MPTRILREGILTSERVNRLGPQAELFYRRLMSVVDDFGRYYAHPALLRSACYPLRVDEVREADISRWLTEVQSAGLIALYAIDSKRYLEMIDFRQQVRAKESKFPSQQPLIKCEADDKQMGNENEANDFAARAAPSTSSSSTDRGDARGERFSVPGVDEVRSYCGERNNSVDPQSFVDYYSANGWTVGRNQMKDWRAAVRNWERNGFQRTNGVTNKSDETIIDAIRKLKAPLNWGPFALQKRFADVGFDGMTSDEQAKIVAAYRTSQYR